MFKYIIKANGHKAIAVKSDLNYNEFNDEIRKMTKKIHKDGDDVVWNFMGVELVNPKVMTANDFADYMPFLF